MTSIEWQHYRPAIATPHCWSSSFFKGAHAPCIVVPRTYDLRTRAVPHSHVEWTAAMRTRIGDHNVMARTCAQEKVTLVSLNNNIAVVVRDFEVSPLASSVILPANIHQIVSGFRTSSKS